jgi:hypothetical protein
MRLQEPAFMMSHTVNSLTVNSLTVKSLTTLLIEFPASGTSGQQIVLYVTSFSFLSGLGRRGLCHPFIFLLGSLSGVIPQLLPLHLHQQGGSRR